MNKPTTWIAVIAVAWGAAAIAADGDPIAQRKELMEDNGKSSFAARGMLRGSEPFDLEKARGIFASIATVSAKMPALFPDDSKTGGETEAAPAIWENKQDFEERFAKIGAAASHAAESVTDAESFKAAFMTVGQQCSGCHELYRIEEEEQD